MTSVQFEALSKIMRSRGSTKNAVKMVLVEGMKQSEAAKVCGISRVTVSKAVQSFCEMHALAAVAVGSSSAGA